MKALTIIDLLSFCLQEYKKGHGNYTVFISRDEEGNGYHALWYSGQAVSEMTKEDREWVEDSNCDLSILKDKDKAIYLG